MSPRDLTLPKLTATRYVTPLKEGGSLPAVVDTAEDGQWVVKFKGAGQGPKALVAEIVVGLLARAIGLPMPDIALVDLDPAFGRTEKDPEIQDILAGSHGLNVGLRYLEGAFNLDPNAAHDLVPEPLPSALVWLDALVMNPDRTHRNPNILVWNRKPFLIDHGAALYFHHDWSRTTPEKATAPFAQVVDHVLLEGAATLKEADPGLADLLAPQVLDGILAAVPDALLVSPDGEADELRRRYVDFLTRRLGAPRPWVVHAAAAHQEATESAPQRLQARR
ncbi:MAG: HipA family kinase [Longimicrobiales bacterium]